MIINWDFKVIAANENAAKIILEKIAAMLDLEITSQKINEYTKFTTLLFSLEIDSIVDGRKFELSDISKLARKIGEPNFIDEQTRNGYRTFEAIMDSRKDILFIPELFWARVFAEQKLRVSSERERGHPNFRV